MPPDDSLLERLRRVELDENGEAMIFVDRDGLSEIISAIKTIERIKEYVKKEGRIDISYGPVRNQNGQRLWCVGFSFIGYYELTLPAAVESATKRQ